MSKKYSFKPRLFLCVTSMLSLCMTSCCTIRHHYPLRGADDFVVDSRMIQEGKQGILAIEGHETVSCSPDSSMLKEYRDAVSEGDVLAVTLYHPKRKDLVDAIIAVQRSKNGFEVSNGAIIVPEVGQVEVEGLALDEVRLLLKEKLSHHIDEVEVFVSYTNRQSNCVELFGMVQLSSIPVDGKIRLYEVLSKARVDPNANLFMSYVLREGSPLPVDLYRLMHLGDMSHNIVMRGRDKIFIANTADATVVIMGEVGNPCAVPVPYGFISLREAIVRAGGIPFTGDRNCILVIRGELLTPKIYQLSWEHIVHLPNNSLLLMPGDTVYISETPITQWNRFIDQLLPSLSSTHRACEIYRIVR